MDCPFIVYQNKGGNNMTIQECKDKIPFDVKVKIEATNKIIPGSVCGRKEQFACVHFEIDGCKVTKEFSWASVSRAMTIGSCLMI